MNDFTDAGHPFPCTARAGSDFCVPEAIRERFVPMALEVARRVRRGARVGVGHSAALSIGYRVAALSEDPRFAFQFDRCFALLQRAALCPDHFRADEEAVAASMQGSRRIVRLRAVPTGLRSAMLVYLAADRAHRPTAAKDVIFRLDRAVKDFGRAFLAETAFTSRPGRCIAALRDADNKPLFTEVEAHVADLLVRGVSFGEAIAARIVLGRCEDYDAAQYVRRLSQQCARAVDADRTGLLVRCTDPELSAALDNVRSEARWRRGKVGGDGERRAEVLYDTLLGWAQELLVGSLDEHIERTGVEPVEPGHVPAYSATEYLVLLRSVRETRSWNGRRLTAAQCRQVETEISELTPQ
ncbi:hypothetical protein [Nocardia sp. NPDC058705]|uniref:hypothetical protein n=1 Tax=Nocardia sp. NPDC058705 TaxID=3346609 RepID=UPI0036CA5BDE